MLIIQQKARRNVSGGLRGILGFPLSLLYFSTFLLCQKR